MQNFVRNFDFKCQINILIYKYEKYYIFFLVLLFLSSTLKAQFSIDAELRPRTEQRHGYKQLPVEDNKAAYFISQRSRLNFNYIQEKYRMGFSIQDVRVWGDEDLYSSTGVKGNNASLDLYQAWLWLKLGSNSFIKVGRQQWSYDNQRLLSGRNWGQHGLTYDGILYGYKKNNFQFDLGLSLNNDSENLFGNEYTPDKMKFLDFIYLKQNITNKSYLSFTGILSGYQKEEDSETVYLTATFGPYLKIKSENYSLSGNIFYQMGTKQTGENVNAYMFSLAGDYQIFVPFNVGIGLDWLSGESDAPGDNSFDILYGGRHRFYGEMDYFSNLYKSTLDLGLRDFFAKFGYEINAAHSVNLNYHFFSLQKEIDEIGAADFDKLLGDEIDFIYRYKANIPVDLRIGFSVFFPSETMEHLQSAAPSDFSYFSYLMLTFTPELFSKE